MVKQLKDKPLPKCIIRLLNWVPILFYKCGLGFIFGKRFLMLTHVGRNSGLSHDTVLEVVKNDEYSKKKYYVASGWGKKSNWYMNIQKSPQVQIKIGNSRYHASAHILDIEKSTEILLEYAIRHPRAFNIISKRLTGQKLKIDKENIKMLAVNVPIVELNII